MTRLNTEINAILKQPDDPDTARQRKRGRRRLGREASEFLAKENRAWPELVRSIGRPDSSAVHELSTSFLQGPASMRLIDLSVAIENGLPVDRGMAQRSGIRTTRRPFEALALCWIAPRRPSSTARRGQSSVWTCRRTTDAHGRAVALRIDDESRRARRDHRRSAVGLVLQAGVKLDFRHLPDGHVVRAREVEDELARINHDLQPRTSCLVNSAGATAKMITWTAAAAWTRSDAVPDRTWRPGRRYRCLVLGCPVQPHRPALSAKPKMRR